MTKPTKELARVRFAPSPTGDLHLGNARTALYNWLFARHHDGVFILRIEDTDLERSTTSSEEGIIDDLKWMGLNWDEGPDLGGPRGPYRQTSRLNIYREKAQQLIGRGLAYKCFCSPEILEEKRQRALAEGQPPRYDGACRDLSPEETARREAAGEKPSIRFKIDPTPVQIHDLIRGDVSFGAEVFGDFIILRSNGIPSYNFAVVIDDHLMGITHVIRGEDHLSNTPRQILLYRSFGWALPAFAHLPMILGPDRTRLSKRHGATSVSHFRQGGYPPAALVNYLALLGWSAPDGQEIISTAELIDLFDLDRVSKSSSIFDTGKLDWLSGHYLRTTGAEKLTTLALPYIQKVGWLSGEVDQETFSWLRQVIEMVQPSLHKLADIPAQTAVVFSGVSEYDPSAREYLTAPEAGQILSAFREAVMKVKVLDAQAYHDLAVSVRGGLGVKGKVFFMTLRSALTGKTEGPELNLLVPVLGKERVVKRLDAAIESFSENTGR